MNEKYLSTPTTHIMENKITFLVNLQTTIDRLAIFGNKFASFTGPLLPYGKRSYINDLHFVTFNHHNVAFFPFVFLDGNAKINYEVSPLQHRWLLLVNAVKILIATP